MTMIPEVPEHLKPRLSEIEPIVDAFVEACSPLEAERVYLLADARTGAFFCEVHVKADRIVRLGTIDVPLDPDDQADYRANRELAEDHVAYERMQEDAQAGRFFSNLVAEYIDASEPRPLKIIGGQHRFEAIKSARDNDINEFHGLKVYFGLDPDQRLDVQLISNTNIAVSPDLLDRMYETVTGPELRDWCQNVGLLESGQDFADRRKRGNPLTVRAARTFIMNYYSGRQIDTKNFDTSRTIPILAKSGVHDPDWTSLKQQNLGMWKDKKLGDAGREFAVLIESQRQFFDQNGAPGKNVDFAEKALNYAVLSAWAFCAGMLAKNETRLKRHIGLRNAKGKDPLHAAALAKGRHKTDAENYRGLGYRTDAKERGRFVELFYAQSEKGDGITAKIVDLAIKKYHAKQAVLEVKKAEAQV